MSDHRTIEEVLLTSSACDTSFCVQCVDVETAEQLADNLRQSWQDPLGKLDVRCVESAVVGAVKLHLRARNRIPVLACVICRFLEDLQSTVQSASYAYEGPDGEVRTPIKVAA